MKKVEIVCGSQGKIILVEGQELPNNKPSQTKEQVINEGDMVDVANMVRARQRHQIMTDEGIVGASYMSKEQKLTLATETEEGKEGRNLTDKVNKKMGIAD